MSRSRWQLTCGKTGPAFLLDKCLAHRFPLTPRKRFRSLGVTTYVLLTGFSPFGGETDQETFQNISLGEVDFPEELFEDVSAQAKDFVAKLLVLNPR